MKKQFTLIELLVVIAII
ncbi:MAG: prepilin-type N-terminal cleavage/methylation domain-containing protein, partial [Lentisphaeria bacterium]|nr:prepilin-type N-terminal cleavage/methylation domain-containing protein [Lentisphaeria bacterium]